MIAARPIRVVPGSLEDDHRFGSSTEFSIGVEEELFLVDPLTGHPTNTSAAVLRRLGEVDGTVKQELHACQVELITGVCDGARDAVRDLAQMRRAVLDTGTGLLASGTHPLANEDDAVITHKERYERIHYLLGDAVVTPSALSTSMWGCQTRRRRSALSTGCAATCLCWWRWPLTRRFATGAIPVSARPARCRCGSGRARAFPERCVTSTTSAS